MKLYLKFRFNNEVVEHVFENIDPTTVGIAYNVFGFAEKGAEKRKSWTYQVSQIIEMNMEEE